MAQLTVTSNNSTANVDLTAEGTTDWEHWQVSTSRTRMTGTPGTLSDWSQVGSFTVAGYNDDGRLFTASNPSVSDHDGIYSGGVFATGIGFQLTCTADDTTIRTMIVHCGQFSADAVMTITMSGGGVTSPQTISSGDPGFNTAKATNVTIVFQAASPGQTLTVTWLCGATNSASYGNVTLSTVTLSQVAAPSTSVGLPQAPAFLMVGPGRFRSPMGIGRIRDAGGAATVLTLTGTAITGSSGTPKSNIAYATTGSSGTASAGTPVSNVSYAASGNAMTGSAGTPVSNLTTLPPGASVTASAGTLKSALAYALSGSQGTSAAGTVVSAISQALSSTSATTLAGTVLANIANALAGSGATSATGTAVMNIGLPVIGSGLTITPGTVTVGNNVSISLAGQSMTVSAGTPGLTVTLPLAGLGLTVSAGTVTEAGGSQVTVPRRAILFSDDKATLPAKLQWNRTHDD